MECFGMQYAGFVANIMALTAFGMGYGLYLYFGYWASLYLFGH